MEALDVTKQTSSNLDEKNTDEIVDVKEKSSKSSVKTKSGGKVTNKSASRTSTKSTSKSTTKQDSKKSTK